MPRFQVAYLVIPGQHNHHRSGRPPLRIGKIMVVSFSRPIGKSVILCKFRILRLLYSSSSEVANLLDEHCTFRSLIRWIQGRRLAFELHPGRHVPRDHNAWGKTMPSGVIRGAAPYFSNCELEQLVVIAQRVSGQCLWDFPIAPFLS